MPRRRKPFGCSIVSRSKDARSLSTKPEQRKADHRLQVAGVASGPVLALDRLRGGFRPSGPGGAPPPRDFERPDPALERADKHARKFGPDAKPFKNRNQKTFRPEGGKKALKERMSGQVYSMDDDGVETVNEPDIDNFAEAVDEDSKENT